MTRKELHALMTGMVFNQYDHRLGTPMQCAHQALELLEAAEEVYAKSEGFRGSIEALEVAARETVAAIEEEEKLMFRHSRSGRAVNAVSELKRALEALEPSSE